MAAGPGDGAARQRRCGPGEGNLGWGAFSVRAWAPGHRGGIVGGKGSTANSGGGGGVAAGVAAGPRGDGAARWRQGGPGDKAMRDDACYTAGTRAEM